MRATSPLGLAGFLMTVYIGCAEPPTGGSEPVVPVNSGPALGVLQGVIDLDRGTLEFSPILPGAIPGFAPAIYGDQNVNVRLYNTPVTVDSSTSTWRWTANVGVRNLRPHPIGDEENALVPLDTIGLYVFFVREPVLGAPCGGCFVRIANYHGTMNFDAPARKYFHWPDRLDPMDSALGDTTRIRRPWIFETSAGVRSFAFSILVAAPWPAPYESRWKVDYTADSLPGSAAPGWKLAGIGGNPTVSGGSLSLRGQFSGLFYRRDPIGVTQDAYVDAIARSSGGGSQPDIGVILSDGVKLIALGVANGTIGLISSAGTFLPGTTTALGNGTHQLQLRKYAADSAVYFVDGVRRARASYAILSADTLSPPLASVAFGALPTAGGSNSTWDNVVYEIGAAAP